MGFVERKLDPRLKLPLLLLLFLFLAVSGFRALEVWVVNRGEGAQDALGLAPMPALQSQFATPAMAELAARYHLQAPFAGCGMCHTPTSTAQLNAFGQAYNQELQATTGGFDSIFEVSRVDLRKALKDVTGVGQDADGDGYDNDLELLLGFHPGDPKQRPLQSLPTLQDQRQRLQDQATRLNQVEVASTLDTDRDGLSDDAERYWGHDPQVATPHLVQPQRLERYYKLLKP